MPEANRGKINIYDLPAEERPLLLDERVAAEVAARAQRHADLWAHHARSVGLRYLPFAPSERSEDVLRRLVLEVP